MTTSNDPLDRVLRMVAEGRLTAEEAAPIIDALQATAAMRGGPAPAGTGSASGEEASAGTGGPPRFARIEIQEGGRRVVNLRVPMSLGRLALARVPGLSADQIAEVEAAVAEGSGGPILDVQDPDGDGVRIVLE
ncbi:MAG TPA: hypothetical protein VK831_03090 [Candidatus Deferrimicrobiaceae bacterium]|nr:hypothetical protein [Candidatus Deferrimicrobiaceae bacterium]